MKTFRMFIAALLIVCVIPPVIFGFTWGLTKIGECQIQFKEHTTCTIASWELGWLVDRLMQVGVYGWLTFGLGTYIFAVWVVTELLVIIIKSK